MKSKLLMLPIVSVLLAFLLSGCFVERRPYYYDDYHHHRYRHYDRDRGERYEHRGEWRY